MRWAAGGMFTFWLWIILSGPAANSSPECLAWNTEITDFNLAFYSGFKIVLPDLVCLLCVFTAFWHKQEEDTVLSVQKSLSEEELINRFQHVHNFR